MADTSTGAVTDDPGARVVAVEEQPDGRQLVLFDDHRMVVVGVARPRPHPVPGCEWLGAHPRPPRARPRAHGSPARRRPIRVLPDARDAIVPGPRSPRRPSHAAERRAEALLVTLLDPVQRAEWEADRAFWVATPYGPVRLGRLYQLVFRPHGEPDREHLLCVVPHGYETLPLADIWSNLLLVLAVDPDEFFRVAIHRRTRRRSERPPEDEIPF